LEERRIFAEGGPDWLEEPSKGGLHAQDVVDLLDTQSFFELLKLRYPTERPGVIDRLVREIVVRELVANALIHQDLTVGGASAMVEVFSNRVEITNPGEPVVPVERFIDGYQSRNERLADLMRRIRACYQHCALKWVTSERMANRSLRERFRLPEGKAPVVSQVTAATIGAGLVRPDEGMGASRRFARYVPFCA
jgi:ATP-dependent DNA helicase RecG